MMQARTSPSTGARSTRTKLSAASPTLHRRATAWVARSSSSGGNVSVANSFFEGNYAIGGDGPPGGDGLGGALYLATGNLSLTNSWLDANVATTSAS